MTDSTQPVIIVASFGNATVKRTLYGYVSPEREHKERIDAKRRAEQLDTSKPDPQVKRRDNYDRPRINVHQRGRLERDGSLAWRIGGEEYRETNRW